jgi:opacity protein-like surface antigen
MKKLLLTIAILTFVITAKSQSTQFGVSVFYYQANYTKGTYANGEKNQVPFVGAVYVSPGLFLEKKINKVVSARLELNIMGKSANRTGLVSTNDGTFSVNYNYKLNYIQLPVLAKIAAAKNFNLYIGPGFGYILSRKLSSSVSTVSFSGGSEARQDVSYSKEEVKKGINEFDLSGHVGLGFDIKKFEIYTAYEQSFVSSFKDPEKQFSKTPKFYTVKLGVSYRF